MRDFASTWRGGSIKRFFAITWVAFAVLISSASAQIPEQNLAAQSALNSEAATSSSEYVRPTVEPADGKWLVDEEGVRYFIEEIPKGVEGKSWVWAGKDKNQIRIFGGLTFDVVEHDDTAFLVKIYEVPEPQPRTPPPPPPSEKELAAVAESYHSTANSQDRFHFTEFDKGLPRRGQWRNGFDVGDMNGDGHPDIVFGPSRKGPQRPNIFLGDGQGSWRRWRQARYPRLVYDYGDTAVADFDGDGHLDMALAMHLTGVVVLRGDGVGNFTFWSDGITLLDQRRRQMSQVFTSRAIVAADWTGDGKPDILAVGEGKGRVGAQSKKGFGNLKPISSNGVLLYVNHGDGSWHPESISTRVFADSIAIGDFTGNGRADFVTGMGTMGNKEILNLSKEDGTWEIAALEALPPAAWVRSVAVGRLDKDNTDDILVGYSNRDVDGTWRTVVDLFYGQRDGQRERRPLHAKEGREGLYSLDTGDLDGDGRVDVVAATGHGDIWVFMGHEDGFFVREESPELPKPIPGCTGYALGLADLDGDGRDEMIVGFAGEPSGYVGFGEGLGQAGCPGEGSLRVWRAE